MNLIRPLWAGSAHVQSAMTTRLGGVSAAPYDSLNLGYATDDARPHVTANEQRVATALGVPLSTLRWVYQVHGCDVHHAEALPVNEPPGSAHDKGDAIVCRTAGLVCGVKVADCMPVLFAAADGSVVAAAHAGWRGLSAGVLERTVSAMAVAPEQLDVWLGACIGPQAFEVGAEVRAAFVAHDAQAATHFMPSTNAQNAQKFLCDLYAIARQRLNALGISRISGGEYCTFSQPDLFFSHRRDRVSGRMAAFVWIDAR